MQNKQSTETLSLKIGLFLTLCLLIVGLVSPIITLKQFVLIQNTFSVVGGVVALLKEGKLFLFGIISVFSIILPLLKIAVLAKLLGAEMPSEKINRYLHWMHLYGKWSMLDVFVVAVLVVVVKLGVVASVEIHYGLYAFAIAVLLTMIITARVVRRTQRPASSS